MVATSVQDIVALTFTMRREQEKTGPQKVGVIGHCEFERTLRKPCKHVNCIEPISTARYEYEGTFPAFSVFSVIETRLDTVDNRCIIRLRVAQKNRTEAHFPYPAPKFLPLSPWQ